eukprot:TRINITY_DN1730_c0_g1_i3.p1 TRINITY_DN1730_c0_g1~~TRINITY_DN1730_c0_g1_i3.p1  ORF type:complete len:290 (-),score=26.82 TRINITY_DN1730_c0_g1_i3:101-970(-)
MSKKDWAVWQADNPTVDLLNDLWLDVAMFLPVRDVVLTLSLTCQSMHHHMHQPLLWQRLLQRDSDPCDFGVEHGDAENWKELYRDTFGFEVLAWDFVAFSKSFGTTPHVKFDDTYKRAEHTSSPLHKDVWGNRSFTRGVHRWQIVVNGMSSSNMWIAIGVTPNNEKHFCYDLNSGFMGCTSVGGTFLGTHQGTSSAHKWSNGSVVTVTLDLNKYTLELTVRDPVGKSGEVGPADFVLPTIPIPQQWQAGPLWPWADLFRGSCSVWLLDHTNRHMLAEMTKPDTRGLTQN